MIQRWDTPYDDGGAMILDTTGEYVLYKDRLSETERLRAILNLIEDTVIFCDHTHSSDCISMVAKLCKEGLDEDLVDNLNKTMTDQAHIDEALKRRY